MNPMLDAGRAVLAQQPFSALLGTELSVLEADRAVLDLPLRHDLLQQNGFAHGGVLCSLADHALTFAGGSALGTAVMIPELKIDDVRPALGKRLCATASVVHAGRSRAVVRYEIDAVQGGEHKLCAAAQGTITQLAEPRKQG